MTAQIPSLLAAAASCPEDRLRKVADDLASAFGIPPAIRRDVDFAAVNALIGQHDLDGAAVVCCLRSGGEEVAFADFDYDRLFIEIGPEDPQPEVEAASAEAFAWQTCDHARDHLGRWLEARGIPGGACVLVCTESWSRDPSLAALDLRCLRNRMKFLGRLVLACEPEMIPAWLAVAPELEVVSYEAAQAREDIRSIVMLSDSGRPQPGEGITERAASLPVSLFSTPQLVPLKLVKGRVRRAPASVSNPQLTHNRFVAALVAGGKSGVADTPIGKCRPLSNGLGPMSPFGHRMGGRLKALARRSREHKVVAVFGGSGVFSPRCFHSETITGYLQDHLNKVIGSGDLDEVSRVTVLNFGEPAGTITDVITRFANLGTLVRPDCVIAHVGANEFGAFGNDSALVGDYNIMYTGMTYGEDGTARPRIEVPVVQLAATVFERLEALAMLVAGTGAAFIAGLQPALCFKRPSMAEQLSLDAAMERYPEFKEAIYLTWRVHAEGIGHLTQRLEQAARFSWLDMSAAFAHTPDVSAFFDHIHLTPDGNRMIAERYLPAVVDALAKTQCRANAVPVERAEATAVDWHRGADRMSARLDAEIRRAESDAGLGELAERLRVLRSEIIENAGKPDLRGADLLSRDAYPLD